jgi:urea transport system ATP-binding protein
VKHNLLQIEGLGVTFGGFAAVSDLNLCVNTNEVRAVIGPNGAGKTTLLDLISGRTRPTSGRILFKGEPLLSRSEHEIVQAGIGRKFQTPSVYEELTVFENLEMAYPGHRSWLSAWRFRRTPQVKEHVEEVARTIFLHEHLDRKAEQLSHGQKQWLEIGSLLMQSPDLMMLDEPVAGMSVRERERTAELLKRLAEGRAVVVVEHDMPFVEAIADAVTVLHQGRVLAEGKMSKVKHDPKVVEVYLGH